jgi:hypothetical protein
LPPISSSCTADEPAAGAAASLTIACVVLVAGEGFVAAERHDVNSGRCHRAWAGRPAVWSMSARRGANRWRWWSAMPISLTSYAMLARQVDYSGVGFALLLNVSPAPASGCP